MNFSLSVEVSHDYKNNYPFNKTSQNPYLFCEGVLKLVLLGPKKTQKIIPSSFELRFEDTDVRVFLHDHLDLIPLFPSIRSRENMTIKYAKGLNDIHQIKIKVKLSF